MLTTQAISGYYSSLDFQKSTNQSAQTQNQTSEPTQKQEEDTYEPATSVTETYVDEVGKIRPEFAFRPSTFYPSYEDYVSSEMLTLSEVNAPGYQPKDTEETLAAASLIAQECWKKYGLRSDNIPETAEGKAAYMSAFAAYHSDERIKTWDVKNWFFSIIPSSLNKVEGTDWWISDGAEALIGHEVLQIPEKEPLINEYGFRLSMPGKYQETSFLTNGAKITSKVLDNMPIVTLDRSPAAFSTKPFTLIEIPDDQMSQTSIVGDYGGKTYKPEIKYEDALGLDGMSMNDRKTFLSLAQSILDNVAPGVDVRQLKFKTGYVTLEDVRQDKRSILLDVADDRLLDGKRNEIEKALNRNATLVKLKLKADASPDKSSGQLTLSVLDASGQELPKNEVRLIAVGKSVITTVDTIKDMDQLQMLELIRAA
jgi:hypothetical protein